MNSKQFDALRRPSQSSKKVKFLVIFRKAAIFCDFLEFFMIFMYFFQTLAQVAVCRRPHLNVFGRDYDTADGTGIIIKYT